ncbi:integrase [Mycolicibacterium austroafricanum]|uniref:Integrase n=1 Tax=Mycolicibacterium austroafricanum TaxID=39687 RepID=A0ABT8HFV3_MYCAO|nr:integrase [Mycolicibacterium austroafricanum]MDN4519648.1 integrase [Mycolicibacterium austroafricanum]
MAGVDIGPGIAVLLNRTLHIDGIRCRFGDPVWDLSAAIEDRHSAGQAVHWDGFPTPFRHACKLYLFALLNIVDDAPRLDSSRSLYPHVKTILGELVPLRRFTTWLVERGVTSFGRVGAEHLDDYLRHVTEASGVSAGSKRSALQAIKRLHVYRDALPAHCRLPEGPLWGGASARGLAHYESSWGKPNTTPRIHPDVMEPLLSAALAVTHTVAADLLPAARNLLAMRYLAHQIAPDIRRAPTRTVSVFETTKAQLECLLAALGRNDASLPGNRTGDTTSVDLMGLAVGGWLHHTELKRMKETSVLIAKYRLPVDVDMLRTNIFSAIGTHCWRKDPVGADELVELLRHVTTACFLVIAYLSGVRTGEALNLRRGCISRDSKLALTLMSGHQLKAEGPRRDRSPATIPWVVTDETAHAVSVLEQVTVSDLLFPAFNLCSQQRFLFGATRTRTPGSINADITSFIEWFNRDIGPALSHPLIGADPDGTIQVPRLRRTLAWHIVRRPGGTIAGATQYGHLHTQMIQGYAGGADAGFLDDITFEQFLHRAEIIHDDSQRLERGEHVSGPAADDYRARIARASTFAGLTVTTKAQINTALSNPDLQIHHGAAVTCVFRRATAACLEPADSSAEPLWSQCRLGCVNAARTDRDATSLREHVTALQRDLATLELPEPLRQRIQTRLIEHRKALAEHESSRPTTIPQQDEDNE